MLGPGVDKLGSRLDGLAQRVGKLQQQLAAETAASRLARWASRHPPGRSEFLRQLGDGNTGSVHEVQLDGKPHRRVAVKHVDWSTPEQRAAVAKRIATEISVLQSLRHPLLPTLHAVYQTGDAICLEMTLCSRGTLWHLLEERLEADGARALPLGEARHFAAELVAVLAHLHDHGLVYVDLKPENVLLQDGPGEHVMLCDMDLVHTADEIATVRQLEAVGAAAPGGPTFWGTLEYVAPEVAVGGAGAYAPASDWWGLGVLLYELLLGLTPYDGDEYGEVLAQVQQGDVLWPPRGVLDAEAEDLLRGLLVADPARRLGAAGAHQIMSHPFFAAVNWSRLAADAERDQRRHAEAAEAEAEAVASSAPASPSWRAQGQQQQQQQEAEEAPSPSWRQRQQQLPQVESPSGGGYYSPSSSSGGGRLERARSGGGERYAREEEAADGGRQLEREPVGVAAGGSEERPRDDAFYSW